MIGKIESEWNTKTGVPMNTKPTLITRDEAMLMFKLMYEELLEFKLAIDDIGSYENNPNQTLIDISDALGDIQYLLNGTVCQFGLKDKWERIQFEIHRSNLTKLTNGDLLRRDDGKILKPDTYSAPDLSFVTI